jgi:hypothetical protein
LAVRAGKTGEVMDKAVAFAPNLSRFALCSREHICVSRTTLTTTPFYRATSRNACFQAADYITMRLSRPAK